MSNQPEIMELAVCDECGYVEGQDAQAGCCARCGARSLTSHRRFIGLPEGDDVVVVAISRDALKRVKRAMGRWCASASEDCECDTCAADREALDALRAALWEMLKAAPGEEISQTIYWTNTEMMLRLGEALGREVCSVDLNEAWIEVTFSPAEGSEHGD